MTEGSPLVSSILPVYNGEAYLAEALKSVFAQTYTNYEVIVVDDGSTDRSKQIINSFEDACLIIQPNQGVAAARNTGLEHANGDYIAFLDQDDAWTPDKLAVQVEYLQAHLDVDYVLGWQKMFLEDGNTKPDWLQQRLLDEPHLGVLLGALLARTRAFETVGRFDITFQNSSDMDWFKRARETDAVEAHIADILLRKRIHGANESHRTTVSREERMRFLRSAIQRRKQGGGQ